jgi:tetratricopeptide (TPR) repeat protein
MRTRIETAVSGTVRMSRATRGRIGNDWSRRTRAVIAAAAFLALAWCSAFALTIEDIEANLKKNPDWRNPNWGARADVYRGRGQNGPAEALALYCEGVRACAQESYTNAVELYRGAARKDEAFPWPWNNMAWILATCPDRSVRNGPLGIEYALRAIKACGSEYWCFAGTLAAAYAEKGDFQRAQEWGRKAVDGAPPERKEDERLNLARFENHVTVTDFKSSRGANAAGPQQFRLRHDRSGKLYGPFEMRNGAKLAIGSNVVFTVMLEGEAPLSVAERRMQSIVVPQWDCRQAPIQDVVKALSAFSVEFDPAKKGMNFVANLPAPKTRKPPREPEPFGDVKDDDYVYVPVTLAMKDVSLLNLLRRICEQAGAKYKVEENTVVIYFTEK